MKVISIIGARPQFIKHAPIQLALQKVCTALTIHTGQHYDKNMSDVFFNELNIPKPEYMLNNMGGNHGEQTGNMMKDIEQIVLKEKPAAMIVYGDTNSTIAGGLVASKLHIPLVHIEAGLRSFNKSMPEEINRIVTDHISDLLFCPSTTAIDNLKNEGITKNVHLCGDVMRDMIILGEGLIPSKKEDFNYYFATIHRPYNTDDKERILTILNTLNGLKLKVLLPLHPRTRILLSKYGMDESKFSNIKFIDPVGYIESVYYQKYSSAVITDSGGVQKEAYWLKKKCVTLRSETEWVETLHNGWNILCMTDLDKLQDYIDTEPGEYNDALYGDGAAAEVIVDIINNWMHEGNGTGI
jgi:UDP-GlcNAc3NAcA epimerase